MSPAGKTPRRQRQSIFQGRLSEEDLRSLSRGGTLDGLRVLIAKGDPVP
jgi:hypothetical protein